MTGGNGTPGAPAETVTLTIDGREVTVARGTVLLEAAARAGVKVPHYCYHPGLSSPAMCRLCLVDIEGAPKLAPSCVTQAADGQVVRTNSEGALEMRRGVLEFYLVNHPLDCPICDQSGECKLQDYVYAEGRVRGRSREPKRVFGRDDFGGDVLFYGDRCVMCTRCVRFMEEVAEDPRLTVVERGSRSVIDTFFESGLEGSPYAGNIVDICPVGALVSKDFLHKARAWDLDHAPSICGSCSQGCNIELHLRDDLVQRLKPRENPEVNGHWMCDYGRARYEGYNRPGRLTQPMVRVGAGLVASAWDEAIGVLVDRLEALEGTPTLVVASAAAANEDLGAVLTLARGVARDGGVRSVFRSPRAPDEQPLPGFPKLVRRKDLVPNRTGAEALGCQRVGDDEGRGGLDDVAPHDGILFVLGDELGDQAADFGRNAALFVFLGTHLSAAAEGAHLALPVTGPAEQEGTFVNHAGRVQRFWPGLNAPGFARPAWMALGDVIARGTGGDAPRQAGDAFARLGRHWPVFSDLTYPGLGTSGAQLSEPVGAAGD